MPINPATLQIALLENIHPYATSFFGKNGLHHIQNHKVALEHNDLRSAISGTSLLGIRSKTHISAADLAAAKQLETIGCFCIGTEQVDLDAAMKLGIPVFNAPYANTRSVAELVLGEIIMLLRRIPEKSAAAHQGDWRKGIDGACEVRGKVLGIVGYGHIGTQLSVLAESIGMRVMFYDVVDKLALGNAQRADSMKQLLSQADIVTLHVPGTPETERMMDAKTIQSMKPGACLINASRGKVVDLDALAKALQSGHLAGAAIDVFPLEPTGPGEAFSSPLQNLPNVILTPHIGGSTLEAQENIAFDVAEKLLRYITNGSTAGAVNFPQVSLPPSNGNLRLRHVHRNEPGMLAKINDIFSHHKLNIAAQYLQTNDAIGYVVIDTDSPQANVTQLLTALRALPGTIRATSVLPIEHEQR